MKLAVLVAVLLIVGAVVAIVARRRSVDDPGASSDLDAEADANRWVVRLGGSLAGIDVRAQAGAGGAAGESLTEATESLRTARAQLARARTPDEYARVSRTAVEGLRHVGAARAALGMDTVPGADGRAEEPSTVRSAISRPLDPVGRSGLPQRGARDRVDPAAGASTRLFATGGLPPTSY
ncbi:hypothetical protein [Streptomyces sp. NPDC002324]